MVFTVSVLCLAVCASVHTSVTHSQPTGPPFRPEIWVQVLWATHQDGAVKCLNLPFHLASMLSLEKGWIYLLQAFQQIVSGSHSKAITRSVAILTNADLPLSRVLNTQSARHGSQLDVYIFNNHETVPPGHELQEARLKVSGLLWIWDGFLWCVWYHRRNWLPEASSKHRHCVGFL